MAKLMTALLFGSIPLWTGTTTATDADVPLAAFDLDALLAGDCVWHCRSCSDPGEPAQHDIVKATTNNAVAQHHETCNLGSCELHECKPDFTATDEEAFTVSNALQFEAALERSTYLQLAAFVTANPDRVRLNQERGALQLLGCDDRVVASYTRHSLPVIDHLLLLNS